MSELNKYPIASKSHGKTGLLIFKSDDTPLTLLSIELGGWLDFLNINGDTWYRERTLASGRVLDAH
jgi:hypothetical protein